MKLSKTALPGVVVLEPAPVTDERGMFTRLFCRKSLESVLEGRGIAHINHSLTHKSGTLRGLHYQRPPHAEIKFIRCLRGRVWDVAVDLRKNSPAFMRWHAEELSAENGRIMVVPEGCAHGFQALEDASELLYLHTEPYAPGFEGGVRFDDPCLGISWPLPPELLSQRDRSYAPLKDFEGIVL